MGGVLPLLRGLVIPSQRLLELKEAILLLAARLAQSQRLRLSDQMVVALTRPVFVLVRWCSCMTG